MNKILLYNYSLSVYFSRGKKELFNKGTWYLLASELFCISISFAMFLLTRFDVKMPGAIILIFYLLIWYGTFYGTKNWVHSQLEKKQIGFKYKNISRIFLYRTAGLLLYLGSFIFFLIVGISTFQGYLNS